APGAGLLVKATIVVEHDSQPCADLFPGYGFGLADEPVEAESQAFEDTSTDDKGVAQFDMTPADLPDTPQPLKATLRTEVYEFGGRPVIKTLSLPIRNHRLAIGLKPLFGDGAGDKPGRLSFKVEYGYYRLEVFDPASGAASSNRFYAGWGASPGIGDTPDKLQLVADKPLYTAGEKAKLLIKPPFAGEVLIS